MGRRKTFTGKRNSGPKSVTGIPKFFGVLNDPLGHHAENELMIIEESEQCKVDKFWGLDKDLENRQQELLRMAQEDEGSLKNEKMFEKIALHKKWDSEFQQNKWYDQKSALASKDIERAKYLNILNSTIPTNDLLTFIFNPGATEANEDFLLSSILENTTAPENQEQPFNSMSGLNESFQTADIFSSPKKMKQEPTEMVAPDPVPVHLDGLQQSKAIIDKAAFTFKQTLRRINSKRVHSDSILEKMTEGQKTKTGVDKSQSSKHSLSLVEELASKIQVGLLDDELTEDKNKLHYNEGIDGHPTHKWDQELLLQLSFSLLDIGGKGFLTESDLSAVSFNTDVHNLLKYTVFGYFIKKRLWDFFQAMLLEHEANTMQENQGIDASSSFQESSQAHPSNPVRFHYGSAMSPLHRANSSKSDRLPAMSPTTRGASHETLVIPPRAVTFSEWLSAARRISVEQRVPLRRIRTADEHQKACENGNGSLHLLDSALLEREFFVARVIGEGDTIWALHCGGVRWLPAVVKKVHYPPVQVDDSFMFSFSSEGNAGPSSSSTGFFYDLWYPLSQQELQRARAVSSSKELLTLPSQLQSGRSFATMPSKPLLTEKAICAYSFDLIDGIGNGVVELSKLVTALQSSSFRGIVETSLALSAIFTPKADEAPSMNNFDGSHLSSEEQVKQNRRTPRSTARMRRRLLQQQKSVKNLKKQSILDPEDIPSLLPVFLDTFSAPREEEKVAAADEHGESVAGSFNSEGNSVTYTEFEGSSTIDGNQGNGNIGTLRKLEESNLSLDANSLKGNGSVNMDNNDEENQHLRPNHVDYISKADFLEFCQAVVDIKKYSIISL